MNIVLSEIKKWNTKYLRKLENHTNALAVNLLDNSETTHRLKRYTVLTARQTWVKPNTRMKMIPKWTKEKSIWITPLGMTHSRASTYWTYIYLLQILYNKCVQNNKLRYYSTTWNVIITYKRLSDKTKENQLLSAAYLSMMHQLKRFAKHAMRKQADCWCLDGNAIHIGWRDENHEKHNICRESNRMIEEQVRCCFAELKSDGNVSKSATTRNGKWRVYATSDRGLRYSFVSTRY
jgi:hypothetical protein